MGEPLHSEEEDQFPTDKIFEVSENSGHVPPMQNLAFASLLVAYYLNIRDGAPASLQGRELREAVFAAISKRGGICHAVGCRSLQNRLVYVIMINANAIKNKHR